MNGFSNKNGSKPIGFDPLFGPWSTELFQRVPRSVLQTKSPETDTVRVSEINTTRTDPYDNNTEYSDPTIGRDPAVAPPCSRLDILGPLRANGSRKLPVADCFGGTGFGIWDHPFWDEYPDYNGKYINDWKIREGWANDWLTLGVSFAQMGVQATDGNVRNMINRMRTGGIIRHLELVVNPSGADPVTLRPFDLASRMWDYTSNRISTQMMMSEWLNVAKYFKSSEPIHFDEPEEHGLNMNDPASIQRFTQALRMLLYDNYLTVSGECKHKISINTYTLEILRMLMQNFCDAIRRGCMTIMPERYYISNYGRFQDLLKFWDDVATDARILLGDVSDPPDFKPQRNIRPFISPVCDYCSSDKGNRTREPMACCGPELMVFQILQAMELGFAGPSLYMGNGMTQDFYDYFILASWLAGCLDDKVHLTRPITYSGLFSILDRLTYDRSLIDDIKSFLPNFSGKIYDNPASCTRACKVWDVKTKSYILKRRKPCCNLPICGFTDPAPICASSDYKPCDR